MDFESFIQSEAMQPLRIVYTRALLDCPETAAIIARLPPPKMAQFYHAALVRASAADTGAAQPLTAEHLCAHVLSARGLANVDGERHATAGGCVQPGPERACPPSLFSSVLSSPPSLCGRYAGNGETLQHLERTMAQREVALQQSVVESVMRMRAAAAVHGTTSTLPEQ
ncbi:hypothetical protein N2W54_003848 [Lotmaria passim]